MMNKEVVSMASDKVEALTKADILRTEKTFRWNRDLPKWTFLVNERELPARPFVLEAAGVPPNDPTNSHQAIKKLKSLGFPVRYEGKAV
jgi:hypothetical protein